MWSLVDSFMPSLYFNPEFNMALDCRIEESQPVKLGTEGGRASLVLDGRAQGAMKVTLWERRGVWTVPRDLKDEELAW